MNTTPSTSSIGGRSPVGGTPTQMVPCKTPDELASHVPSEGLNQPWASSPGERSIGSPRVTGASSLDTSELPISKGSPIPERITLQPNVLSEASLSILRNGLTITPGSSQTSVPIAGGDAKTVQTFDVDTAETGGEFTPAAIVLGRIDYLNLAFPDL